MDINNKVCYSGISVEMFSSFFSSDRKVTESVINTLLEGTYTVEEINSYSVDEKMSGFYHPYVVLDAYSSVGKCMMILTPIDESTKDVKTPLVNYMLSCVSAGGRNTFSIVIVFDSTEESSSLRHPIELDMMKGPYCCYLLCTVRLKSMSISDDKSALISDLMCSKKEDIKNDDIRRVYDTAYKASGLEERERVAYALWLESVRRDIQKLGFNPDTLK